MSIQTLSYTWSRWAHNPVEHVANPDDEFAQPLCGARLDIRRQTIQPRPSGLYPVCQRCQHKALRRHMQELHPSVKLLRSNADLIHEHGEQHHRYSPNHVHAGENLGPDTRPPGWKTGDDVVMIERDRLGRRIWKDPQS